MRRILVVEDNAGLAEGLRLNLVHDGHEVRLADNGLEGLSQARRWAPELIILDLMLPHLDGFEVLRTLRDEGHDVPVLVLSARAAETDRLRGFRLGADDYVIKPFSLPELLARVNAMLRRRPPAGESHPPIERWQFGAITVDAGTHEVRREGELVALRPREFDLLVALLRHAGRVVTRAELLNTVWSYEPDVVSRTVDVHILELRRKLEPDPAHPIYIVTVRKTGYRIRTDSGR